MSLTKLRAQGKKIHEKCSQKSRDTVYLSVHLRCHCLTAYVRLIKHKLDPVHKNAHLEIPQDQVYFLTLPKHASFPNSPYLRSPGYLTTINLTAGEGFSKL
jgi:hypothetical protein